MAVIDESEYWKKQFFSHFKTVERLAARRFPDESTAIEAVTYISDKIAENNWERLRSYKNKSSFKTFLCFIVRRLSEEFARDKFGYIRPPKWLNKRGSIWVRIYKMLCWERISVSDTIESLVTLGQRYASIVEEAVEEILSGITDCGKKTIEVSADDFDAPEEMEENSLQADRPVYRQPPDQVLSGIERISVLKAVYEILKDPQNDLFDQEECVFLLSIYDNGLNVSAAGKLLGWNVNQASGRHRRLLEKIREYIGKKGFKP